MVARQQSEMSNSQIQTDSPPEMAAVDNMMTVSGLAPFIGTLLFGKCPMFGGSTNPSTLARIKDDASQEFATKKKKRITNRPQTIDKIPSTVAMKLPLESEANSRGTATTDASTSSSSSTKSTSDEILQAYRREPGELPCGEIIDRGIMDEQDTSYYSESTPQQCQEISNSLGGSQTNCEPNEDARSIDQEHVSDGVNKDELEKSDDCQIKKKSKKKKKKARVILPENFRVGLSRTESFAQTPSVSAKSQKSALSNRSGISRAVSIVSASKSVKSLPREVELESIDEGSLPSSQDLKSKSNKPKAKGASEVIQVNDLILTDAYGIQGKYSGSFAKQSRQPHGFGRFESVEPGDWYEGEFRHGERIGLGRMSQNQDFYQGGFYAGEPHGEGVKKFADGRIFEGTFVQGSMSHGTMTYVDGSIYTGGWANELRHGKGQTIFEDSSVYVGQFQSGAICGFGKMLWMDGGYYEGEWENGLQEGFGKEVLKNGEVRHEGLWTKGLPIRK